MSDKFKALLDESKTIDASTITNSSTPWKDRIIEYMTSQPDAACTDAQILEATDDKLSDTNFTKRKHCLDSQFTYLRQDYHIHTKKVDNKTVLLGIEKNNKVVPFKNAVKYLK